MTDEKEIGIILEREPSKAIDRAADEVSDVLVEGSRLYLARRSSGASECNSVALKPHGDAQVGRECHSAGNAATRSRR